MARQDEEKRTTGGSRKSGARKTAGSRAGAARKGGAAKAAGTKRASKKTGTARKGGAARKAAPRAAAGAREAPRAAGARKAPRAAGAAKTGSRRPAARTSGAKTGGKRTAPRASSKIAAKKAGGERRTAAPRSIARRALWIESPDQHAERPGQTLATRNHDVIRGWAEARGAVPATAPGTEHDGRPGVLRFDFPKFGGGRLRQVDWDEWFETFDARNLVFLFQEQLKSGRESNFFRLDNPEREDG